jgi:hypothetical protein
MHRLGVKPVLKKRGMSRTSYRVNPEQGKGETRHRRHVDPRGREDKPHDSTGRTGRLDPTTLLIKEDTGGDGALLMPGEASALFTFGSHLVDGCLWNPPSCCCFLYRIPLRSPSCCFDCTLAVVIVDLEPQILFISSYRSRFLSDKLAKLLLADTSSKFHLV